MTWLSDENGNKCSVEYFGSKEAAQKALDTLRGCKNCTNCSDCSYCSYCTNCSDCSRCTSCSRCSDCARCLRCSYCSCCSHCLRCSCCSNCSLCVSCTRCSRCSRWSYKEGKEIKLEMLNTIPVIKNIHQRIYKAASRPNALSMKDWHTCEKTHCRAGWTVMLAGEDGKKLETFFNTELAAMLIYEASGYKINPARFYDDNDAALADMKQLAEKEGG